jgi:hypothetical protein
MTRSDRTKPIREVAYIMLSLALWMMVEYVTVWHAKLTEWVALMPYVLIQYLIGAPKQGP